MTITKYHLLSQAIKVGAIILELNRINCRVVTNRQKLGKN